MKKKLVLLLLVILLAAGYITLVSPQGKMVKTATASIGDFSRYYTTTGMAVSVNEHQVFIPFTGTIEKVYVKEGSYVEAGDPIFKMATRDIEDELKAVNLKLLEATSKSVMSYSDTNQTPRLSELKQAAQNGSVEYNTFNSYVDALRSAQASAMITYDSVSHSLSEHINYLENKLLSATVYAPISGKVHVLNHYAGMQAYAGTSAMSIGKEQYKIVAEVGERLINDIRYGQHVNIKPQAEKGIIYSGKVLGVEKRAQSVMADIKSTVGVVEIEPLGYEGYYGAGADIEIEYMRNEDKIILDTGCLFYEDDKAYVFVVEEQVAKKRSVAVGGISGYDFEVLSGLDVGEEAILNPDKITEGDRVEIDGRGN